MRAITTTVFAALAFAATAAAAAPLRPVPAAQQVFPYGVSWYPEAYPETEWAAELDLMVKAHVTFVRMAEFAWVDMEPREGVYDFVWLDRAMAMAKARGLRIVLGTPTAAPPAWLTSKYPEVLAVDEAGKPAFHGWRRQFSVSSPRYRHLAKGIAARLAERYGRDPAVIGFQIDNEFGRETLDPAMQERFRGWMKARYGTIAALNERHYTRYWSLKYDDWSQITIPRRWAMPALWIDWLRFTGDIWAEYQQDQIDAMRPYLGPDKLLTTNVVAKYDNFDFSTPAPALDFVGWDWYFEEPVMIPADGAMQHDMYRGFLKRAPWVLETAAGSQSGGVPSYFQLKGETRAMAWQAIGHGTDGYAYWVWRAPINGSETFHGSVVDAGGRPRPIYDEIAQTGREIAKAWPALRGTTIVADTLMLFDYPNRWALEREPKTDKYDVWKLFTQYRAALVPVSTGVDVHKGVEDAARYRLVVAPNLFLLDPAKAAALLAYVRNGGHLVVGPRSGTKDEDSNLNRAGQFEPLAGALGVCIDMTQPPIAPIALDGPLGKATVSVWAERLTPEASDLDVLYRYGKSDGWLDGAPAVVSRAVGKGRITYVGAWLDEAALSATIAWAAGKAGVVPPFAVPEGVEVNVRRGKTGTNYVAINWSEQPRTLALPGPMRDLLGGGTTQSITLDRFGVAVLAAAR